MKIMKGRSCVVAVSGNSNNSVNAGSFYVNSNNAFGSANANYGSRLSYCLKYICKLLSMALAKTQNKPVLDGKKVGMNEVLDRKLVVLGFAERNSRFAKSPDGKYLIIQVSLEGERYVFFTASSILRKQLEEHQDKLPFTAKITNNGNYYTLTGAKDESDV